MASASKKLYQTLAEDLGDAVYAARVGKGAEEVVEALIADIAMTLALNDKMFATAKFNEAVEDRVSKRADEVLQWGRRD